MEADALVPRVAVMGIQEDHLDNRKIFLCLINLEDFGENASDFQQLRNYLEASFSPAEFILKFKAYCFAGKSAQSTAACLEAGFDLVFVEMSDSPALGLSETESSDPETSQTSKSEKDPETKPLENTPTDPLHSTPQKTKIPQKIPKTPNKIPKLPPSSPIDRKILCDMFHELQRKPVPSYIFLATSVGNCLTPAIHRLTQLGFKIFLLIKRFKTSIPLSNAASYRLKWENAVGNEGGVYFKKIVERLSPLDYYEKPGFFIDWDLHAHPLILGAFHIKAVDSVFKALNRLDIFPPEVSNRPVVTEFLCYGNSLYLPAEEYQSGDVTYEETSLLSKMKSRHVTNIMLAHVLTNFLRCKKPSVFVLVTDNEDLSEMAEMMVAKGHKIYLLAPNLEETPLLCKACTRSAVFNLR